MRICIDKRTNKVYPDFQGNPTPGTLIQNAVRQLTAKGESVTEADFEEKEVDATEYQRELDAWKQEIQAEVNLRKQQDSAIRASLVAKLKAIGLTDEELKIILR